MNRRDLLRNTLFAMGAAATGPSASARVFAPGYDAFDELARTGWKPIFLDAHQNETLIAVSDAIIPATDTPGAKAALVNRFLDLVLAAESAQVQQEFLASLAWMDTGSMQRYKVTFLELSPEEKDDFFNLLAWPHTAVRWHQAEAPFMGNRHFNNLKNWTSKAFYTSPTGLKELGWNGSFPAGNFTGCEHTSDRHDSA